MLSDKVRKIRERERERERELTFYQQIVIAVE